ncbi:hypothetical protein [Hymenobacter baengnokdamensis]|uniref:hypothetical protein n=1 Tax=Hymenobacter baengnokdamensis TaxID=2615203 RepID=UPI001245ECAC|nr:hypothetical protein [Hymenobacter baengnokdamensis]
MLRYFPLGLLWLATAASAQIEPVSPARQRAAERQARRAAHTVEAPYKDSHLDAPHRPLRRGESAPLTRVANEPRFGRDGAPHVTEPKFPGLRRHPKSEPKP